jgi:tetratricopeptide (TPR) repeat protein
MTLKPIFRPYSNLFLAAILFFSVGLQAASSVTLESRPLTLPTYQVAEPDSNPIFFEGEGYQGSSKVIYPYPFLDQITDDRREQTWNAVYLENEYIQVSFLPELGGRLFSALDKTNNYDFVYRQKSIKPALIGMLGAWISGGIEWCVLHHHRNTTYMPVDFTMIDNPDGSRTFVFGETERRHRMKWTIAATVEPGKSYVKVTGKIYNVTPYPWSFLNWANVAVNVNNDYQVIFPPSVSYATFHAKNDFVHWPVGAETYQDYNFTGVDISWWKNHENAGSFFAWNMKENFMGGYDHGEQAGIVHIGNHHIQPNGKLWQWGTGARGKMWDKILADDSAPYAELMVGAYSDNQPDYSWIGPYEVKTWTQYWYPVRDIGGFKNASIEGAVNLQMTDEKTVKFGFYTTSKFKKAKAVLTAGQKILFSQTMDIDPATPFVKTVTVEKPVQETDLEAKLLSASNEVIISYKPVQKSVDSSLPDTVKAPAVPKDIKTVEELYLIGQRLGQFYHPSVSAMPYYEEALKRDPGDSRVNTALGMDCNKKGMYAKAEKYLRKAIERLSYNHTRPRDCEAYYQLGLALQAQGKIQDAVDNFYRAVWDQAFSAASYYQLARISSSKGDWNTALEQVNKSVELNSLDSEAKNLKIAVLRQLNRAKESANLAEQVLADDPLNFRAANELILLAEKQGNKKQAAKQKATLAETMRDETESYLELAVSYYNAGLFEDAIDVLNRAVSLKGKPVAAYPMVYYYLGYLHQLRQDNETAMKYYNSASTLPHDRCYPFRNESIAVLKAAIEANPKDVRAPYYLGNLLYDKQPKQAIKFWEKARDLDGAFALVHRNLGWGYYHVQQDVSKAIASYETSFKYNSRDPRLLAELDVMYKIGGVAAQKRLALLEANMDTVKQRDDCFTGYLDALVCAGRYDDAIAMMNSRHFHAREGGTDLKEVYLNLYTLRGINHFTEGKFKEALADLISSGKSPENLELEISGRDMEGLQINYLTGLAWESSGDSVKAKECYEKCLNAKKLNRQMDTKYYLALAQLKLNQAQNAQAIFDELIETGTKQINGEADIDFFVVFKRKQDSQIQLSQAHYLIALGQLGKGDLQAAKEQLQKTLELNPNHLWAKFRLGMLEKSSDQTGGVGL